MLSVGFAEHYLKKCLIISAVLQGACSNSPSQKNLTIFEIFVVRITLIKLALI